MDSGLRFELGLGSGAGLGLGLGLGLKMGIRRGKAAMDVKKKTGHCVANP